MEKKNIPKDIYIEVIDGVETDIGKTFEVNNKTITIGRNRICDFSLNDPHVSGKHCQLVFIDDHFTIMDLNSLNKTKINGSDHIQRNLEHEDELLLGKTTIKFLWKDQNNIIKWYN